jgi:hypothetical protein
MVTVYNYWWYDRERDESIIPAAKRTLERIKEIGGDPIPDTAEWVDEADLDEEGRYNPTAKQLKTLARTSSHRSANISRKRRASE